MNQTLKISIVRGSCRFATPLYLGGSYTLSFDGERSDEANSVLFTKPRSTNPNDSSALSALAQTTKSGTVVTLNLNKQVLLDYFEECGECDTDGTVDVHAYVFDSAGVILADADVSIEYKPVTFIVDTTAIATWSGLDTRITALESKTAGHDMTLASHATSISELGAADTANLNTAKAYADTKSDAAVLTAKQYTDSFASMLAKMQYVKNDELSTESLSVYNRIYVTTNANGEYVLAIDTTPKSIEGGDPETGRYVYIDTAQTITGAKTFSGAVALNGAATATTKAATDNSTNVATTAYVVARISADLVTFLTTLKASTVAWTGAHTFSQNITASAGLTGNVTGNLTGNVTGNVTGNLTGDVTGSVDASGTGKSVAVQNLEPSGYYASNLAASMYSARRLGEMLYRSAFLPLRANNTDTGFTFRRLIPNKTYEVYFRYSTKSTSSYKTKIQYGFNGGTKTAGTERTTTGLYEEGPFTATANASGELSVQVQTTNYSYYIAVGINVELICKD